MGVSEEGMNETRVYINTYTYKYIQIYTHIDSRDKSKEEIRTCLPLTPSTKMRISLITVNATTLILIPLFHTTLITVETVIVSVVVSVVETVIVSVVETVVVSVVIVSVVNLRCHHQTSFSVL